MYEEMFSKSFSNMEGMIEPMLKTNKLAVAQLERLVSFQMSTLQSYVDLGLEQMKSAAEINGPQSLQAFWSKQVEVGSALRQKLLDDTKTLVDLGNGMKDEFTKLAEDNVKEFTKAAPKAPGQSTAKKAA